MRNAALEAAFYLRMNFDCVRFIFLNVLLFLFRLLLPFSPKQQHCLDHFENARKLTKVAKFVCTDAEKPFKLCRSRTLTFDVCFFFFILSFMYIQPFSPRYNTLSIAQPDRRWGSFKSLRKCPEVCARWDHFSMKGADTGRSSFRGATPPFNLPHH